MVALKVRAEAAGHPAQRTAQMEAINTDRPGTRFQGHGAQVGQGSAAGFVPQGLPGEGDANTAQGAEKAEDTHLPDGAGGV